MVLLLIIICVIVLVGGLPVAPWGGWHSYGWNVSGIGLILIVLLAILLFTGRL